MIRRSMGGLFLWSLACLILCLAPGRPLAEQNGKASPVDRYRLALRADPHNLHLHYLLGLCLLGDNRVGEALTELRLAYAAFADSGEMNYHLGLASARAGDLESAELYFEQAEALGAHHLIELCPLADAYRNLGISYLEADALEAAVRVLHRSLALDPSRIQIRRLLGDLYARQGKTDLALQEFGSFLEGYPDDRTAREHVYTLHFNRARERMEREAFDTARQDIRAALAAMPGSPLALYYLGRIDYRQGRLRKAAENLVLAYQGAGADIRRPLSGILFECSASLLEAGHPQEALGALTPLLAEPEAGMREHFLAGNIHSALGESLSAYRYFQQVTAIDPQHGGATVNLASTSEAAAAELVARGIDAYMGHRYGEALDALEEALLIRPSEPSARTWIDKIRSEAPRRAAAHFEAAAKALDAGELQEALDQATKGRRLAPREAVGEEIESLIRQVMEREAKKAVAEGQALIRENLLSEAEQVFAMALKLHPDNKDARRQREQIAALRQENALEATARGNLALEEGRLREARTAFETALRLQPELDAGREGLAKTSALLAALIAEELQWGRRARSAGDLVQARTHFVRALALRDDPAIKSELDALDDALENKLENLLRFARLALFENDFRHARMYYERIIDLEPGHLQALAGLTEVAARSGSAARDIVDAADEAMAKGRAAEALQEYREAIALDPANARALSGLQESRSRVEKELSPLLDEAFTAMARGDLEAAQVFFAGALRLDPFRPEALQGLGRIDQTRDKSRPQDGGRLYLRGIELYTAGRYREAISTWKRVLDLAPGHPGAPANIERAERKLRRNPELS